MHEPNAPRPLPLGTITVYAAPMLGTGFVFFFLSTYLMKFATDVAPDLAGGDGRDPGL